MRFRRVAEEVKPDAHRTQIFVVQRWEAACGCKIEITLSLPEEWA
jgi:hypothetical protein